MSVFFLFSARDARRRREERSSESFDWIGYKLNCNHPKARSRVEKSIAQPIAQSICVPHFLKHIAADGSWRRKNKKAVCVTSPKVMFSLVHKRRRRSRFFRLFSHVGWFASSFRLRRADVWIHERPDYLTVISVTIYNPINIKRAFYCRRERESRIKEEKIGFELNWMTFEVDIKTPIAQKAWETLGAFFRFGLSLVRNAIDFFDVCFRAKLD